METDLLDDEEVTGLVEEVGVPEHGTQTIYFKVLHLNPSALKHLKFDSLSDQGLRVGDIAVTLHQCRDGLVRAEPERRGISMLCIQLMNLVVELNVVNRL